MSSEHRSSSNQPWLIPGPVSPSPTASHRHLEPHFGSNSTRMSLRPSSSRPTSIRPSLFTNMSNEDSGGKPRHGLRAWSLDPRASIEDRWDADRASFMAAPATERAVAWRERGRATAMLRTSSDGADVAIEENGMEWEVLTPHGTGKGQQDDPNAPVSELQRRYAERGTGMIVADDDRRHSLQDRTAYKELRISPAHVSVIAFHGFQLKQLREHLAIDVEMCAIVLELRRRERQLASKAKELKVCSTFPAIRCHLIQPRSSRKASSKPLKTSSTRFASAAANWNSSTLKPNKLSRISARLWTMRTRTAR